MAAQREPDLREPVHAGPFGSISGRGLLARIEQLESRCLELEQTCDELNQERLAADRRRLELEQRCKDLERYVASQRRLLEVSEKLLMTLEPDAVLETLGGWLRSVVAYDSMSIHHVDESGLRPAIFAADAYSRVVRDPGIRPDEGLGKWVLGHREAVLVNDAQLDPRCASATGEPVPPQALIVAPLVAGDRVTGLIYVSRLGSQRFTDHEFDLVKLFAAQASTALRNARAHRAISDLAERDSLTGLRNHGAFQADIAELIGRGGPFALLMLDLDDFKAFNDTQGHPAGDGLLRRIASAMAGATREADGLYRYGGDEFAVLLPGAHREQAMEVAGRVRRAVSNVQVGEGFHAGVSAGVACYPEEAGTREELVAIADGMLYLAKRGIALHAPRR